MGDEAVRSIGKLSPYFFWRIDDQRMQISLSDVAPFTVPSQTTVTTNKHEILWHWQLEQLLMVAEAYRTVQRFHGRKTASARRVLSFYYYYYYFLLGHVLSIFVTFYAHHTGIFTMSYFVLFI